MRIEILHRSLAVLFAATLLLPIAGAAQEEEEELTLAVRVEKRTSDEFVRTVKDPEVRSRVAAQSCSAANTTKAEEARRAGAIRAQVATDRARGIHPTTGQSDRMRTRSLAAELIGWDVNYDQVIEITEEIRDKLTNHNLQVACTTARDPYCSGRNAYVVDYSRPIHLCPSYFKSSAEERIRTIIHETAHLAGIGEEGGESYCGLFDCQINCGGFYAADSWAHFIHCASGRPADNP